jgi:hypothetical protein
MPAATTIDHSTLIRLVQDKALRSAHVIGHPGGWGVEVRVGRATRPLAATRSGEVRVFKRLETLVGYLKGIGISSFDVDAAEFNTVGVKTSRRPDASAALKHAHRAAAHDKWFRAEVTKAIEEADDPATPWVSHDDVKTAWAAKRARLSKLGKRAERGGA